MNVCVLFTSLSKTNGLFISLSVQGGEVREFLMEMTAVVRPVPFWASFTPPKYKTTMDKC